MRRTRSVDERQFYETEALRGGWSVRQLDRQISSPLIARTLLSNSKRAILEKGSLAMPADATLTGHVGYQCKEPARQGRNGRIISNGIMDALNC